MVEASRGTNSFVVGVFDAVRQFTSWAVDAAKKKKKEKRELAAASSSMSPSEMPFQSSVD